MNARQEEIASKIAAARGKLSRDTSPNTTVERTLEQRKFDIAPTVIVIENLAQILPDDTYVTTLQIDGNKLRITGVARNAAALIELMERSTRFSQATFSAPTTRLRSDPGDRFQNPGFDPTHNGRVPAMSTMIERNLDRYPSSAVLIYAACCLYCC